MVRPANWIGLAFATGFYLIGFGRYLTVWVPIPEWITAAAAGGLLIFFNSRGTRLTGTVEKAMVGAWLLLLVGFAIWGFFNTQDRLHEPFLPEGWGAVIGTLGLIIVTFTGFEKTSMLAEEIKEPRKNLPRAIIGAVIVSTIVSVAVIYVLTDLIPYENVSELRTPPVAAARQFAGRLGETAMVAAALLATASAANAGLLASSRISYAMGRDEVLPGWFGKMHGKHKTPQRAVIVTGLIAVGLAMSGQAPTLAEISSALFMISYALLVTALITMRHFQPDWYRPSFRVPLYPWLPVLGGVASLAVILTMERLSQLAGVVLAVASVIWYYVWARERTGVEGELARQMNGERAPVDAEALKAASEEAAPVEKQQILVFVGETEGAVHLAQLAGRLAKGRGNTAILAVRVIEIPYNVALRHAREWLPDQAPWQDVVARGVPEGIEVATIHQVGRSVAGGIVSVVAQRSSVGLLLLGLEGPISPRWLGSRIDHDVEERAPCDVAVLVRRGFEAPRRVVVAVDDNEHARMALQLGQWLQRDGAEQVTALRVVVPGDGETEGRRLVDDVVRSEGLEDAFDVVLVKSDSVANGLIQATEGYDLLIVGKPIKHSLKEHVFGIMVDKVAKNVSCSVLLARRRPAND